MNTKTFLAITVAAIIGLLTLSGCDTEQRFSTLRAPNTAHSPSPDEPGECVDNPAPVIEGNLIVEAGTAATLTYRVENNPLWVIWLPEGEQTFIGKTISVTIEQVGEYHGIAWGSNNCNERVEQTFTIVVIPARPVPPVVTLTQTPAITTTDVNATFAFTATHSGIGIRQFNCAIDGAPAANCNSPQTYSSLTVGHHTFTVSAVDNNNLQSEPVSFRWEVLRVRVPLTEHFTINSSGRKLDIVIVDDNSPSMVEEQKKMAARFSTFLQHLNGLDWQLGIITTDASSGKKPYQDGRLVPFVGAANTYAINPATPNLANVFSATVVRKEWGSDQEEGIRAIFKMLQRPENRFMLREQSHLATIIISDEDERSNGKKLKSYNTPENLLNTFTQLFGTTNTFSNHSIVLMPNYDTRTCRQIGSHQYGATYARLSQLTGGTIGDICAGDYGDILKNIGNDARNKTFTAVLKCEPVGPVAVKLVPQPTSQIQHTLAGKQLTLSPYPPIGTHVEVTYFCD
jgi:hypothetical protein